VGTFTGEQHGAPGEVYAYECAECRAQRTMRAEFITWSQGLFLLFIREGWLEFMPEGVEETVVLCQPCQYTRRFLTVPEPAVKLPKARKGLILRDTKPLRR